jgi:hypothetical protein
MFCTPPFVAALNIAELIVSIDFDHVWVASRNSPAPNRFSSLN